MTITTLGSNKAASTPGHLSVIFLHLPKTGGTTLNRIMDREYDSRGIYDIEPTSTGPAIGEFTGLPQAQRSTLLLVRGHLSYGLHSSLPGDSTYITLLRHPVERIISHYHYVLATPSHYLHREVVDSQMTLQKYVTAGLAPELDNGQTKALSGNYTFCGQCTEADLELAKANLRSPHFGVVGVTEHFDESLLLMHKHLGWKHMPVYRSANVTRDRPAFTDVPRSAIDAIRDTHLHDWALYECACEMLHARVASLGQPFQLKLAAFRTLNRRYQRRRRVMGSSLLFLQKVGLLGALHGR